eukprot:CAMPEP_0171056886 /NCGR_PEP_ID=MMETSP0766_2-20121228/1398_1 /TAXON_ID=439317 /ORGANISM="Gambierdiscus australes, Strain CAWD 149" /LENGTH=403 /DNA_ID=CAMNT_0011511889 /DNA_START=105 /DNA_END=1316 /DNA_ORIENTATION=+
MAVRNGVDTRSRRGRTRWTVNLLVVRHGVSCTNIIEKWSQLGGADFLRGWMLDPPLAGMADLGNEEGKIALKRWSNETGFKIDAVLSSVLLRAMQTAVGMHEADPLYIVPFIREHANGLSNNPSAPKNQTAALQEMVPGQKVNYDFVNMTHRDYDKGTWEDFVGFLRDKFLPFIISKLDPESEQKRTITLLIATHSKFLKEQSTALSDRCQRFWDTRDGKPFNSQVFLVNYTFSSVCEGCKGNNTLRSAGDHCQAVYNGTSIYDAEGDLKALCVSDMGDRCTDKIAAYSLSPRPLIRDTLEARIAAQAHEVKKSDKQVEEIRQELGCRKEEDTDECQERLREKTRLVKRLQEAVEKDRVAMDSYFGLLDADCIGIGYPNVTQFARYMSPDLPVGALPLSGPAE